ncbi:MAG TPA: imelysin family protein, partial [Solirubrobacterales bacterium]|nr:imelysin family protein [Solirubrobacterales bacterium]
MRSSGVEGFDLPTPGTKRSPLSNEEERYSHIDLVDFEANVEGAEAAFEAVEPLLSKKDPKLAKEIEADFDKAFAALVPYETADGFVSYE